MGSWFELTMCVCICSSKGSSPMTLNLKTDPETIVAQRSVRGCESIQPVICSLQAGQKQRNDPNMAKVQGQLSVVREGFMQT